MTQKLIKLSEEHYIVVDDSEIKEGKCFDIDNKTIVDASGEEGLKIVNSESSGYLNITHSTKTLIYDNELGYTSIPNVSKINLSEVEEAIYGYSVEKMAENHLEEGNGVSRYSYTEGFKAHKELVKDKLHSLLSDFYIFATNGEVCNKDIIDEFLIPKTEWEVEFIDGKLKLKS